MKMDHDLLTFKTFKRVSMDKKLWMTQLNGWFNASEDKEC